MEVAAKVEVNEVVKEQAAKESVREQGVVKFFDEAKGWGFITRQDTSELFVHFASIQAEGFKTLHDGQGGLLHASTHEKRDGLLRKS